jgi:hypothetical protein
MVANKDGNTGSGAGTDDRTVIAGIRDVKIAHFASEARTLDAARMKDMQAEKRSSFCGVARSSRPVKPWTALLGNCLAHVLTDRSLWESMGREPRLIRPRGGNTTLRGALRSTHNINCEAITSEGYQKFSTFGR